MPLPFLDTNIFLRHLLHDVPDQATRATAYLERIERGDVKVRTADTVIFELVFTLQRSYRIPKADIANSVVPLIELPSIVLPGKRRFRTAFDLYVRLNLPFADAYHASVMQQQKLTEIVTFDRDFERIPGITRIEP